MVRLSLKNKIALTIIEVGVVSVVIGAFFVFQFSKNEAVRQEERFLTMHTRGQVRSLDEVFSANFNLVKTIAKDPLIVEYLKTREKEPILNPYEIKLDSSVEEVSEATLLSRLQRYNIGDNYSAIYVMNHRGITLASTDQSFVNNDYSFRDYFRKAIDGNPWAYMAIGVTSKKAGFYFSYPIRDGDQIIGVAVVKLKTGSLENSINISNYMDRGAVMLTDDYGVIITSNEIDRIYKTVGILTTTELDEIKAQRRFEGIALEPLGYGRLETPLAVVQGTTSLSFSGMNDTRSSIMVASQIGSYPFYLILERPIDLFLDIARKYAFFYSMIVALIILSIIIALLILIPRELRPILTLKNTIVNYGKGDLATRYSGKKQCEIGEIGAVFNAMADKNKELVVGLEDKIDKLQRLNRVMVGREKKILELKSMLKKNIDKSP